jgi:hypothetical protein
MNLEKNKDDYDQTGYVMKKRLDLFGLHCCFSAN